MKYSVQWLRELCDFELEPQALAETLTRVGFEVEGVTSLAERWKKIIVVEVAETKPHPNADKLKLVKVLDGEGTREIVCGAPNVTVGMRVPLAEPGAVVGGKTIESASVRGVTSAGMLCSERELGISDDHAGLCALPGDWALGKSLADTPLSDTLLEVSVTPNRPDVLCHFGLGREIAAATQGRVKKPRFVLREEASDVHERLALDIVDQNACKRYLTRVVTGVKVAPSPLVMRARLAHLGQRAVSNVVDITNWVMLELGHPLHAFDLGRLASVGKQKKVIVRRAQAGEKLKTLDGQERLLIEEDLVVADNEQALALAGIMGGESSEITDSTSDVLLETAYFEPQIIYRTAKRLNLHTEASHRFWRGADIDILALANERAAFLLAEHAGGKVCRGELDVYPRRRTAIEVSVSPKRTSAYLGLEVSAEDMAEHLTKLELTLKSRTDQALTFGIPSFRVDFTQEVDLIEEVAREIGYDKIPETLPEAGGPYVAPPPQPASFGALRDQLCGFGLSEAINYSFVSPKAEALFRPADIDAPLVLQTPIAQTESVMRTSLMPGLLANVRHNLARQVGDIRLFELGRIFLPRQSLEGLDARDAALPDEPQCLGVVLSGPAAPFSWGVSGRQVDFFDLKRVVDWLLVNRDLEVDYRARGAPAFLHPGASAVVIIGGQVAGWLGEVHPHALSKLEIDRPVFAAELSLSPFAQRLVAKKYKPLPRFPGARRDVAMIVPDTMAIDPLLAALRTAGIAQLEDVRMFDVYQGKPIKKGHVSVTFALFFRDSERTLTDDEVLQHMQKLVGLLKEKFPVEIREG